MKRGFSICAIFLSVICFGQKNKYPNNYFRHPLDIRMELVANFGEIRSNHWHMGLDIRTQQRENLKVFAAAEGYISRVSVAPFGFGRAIYINHPNGYTTLYAHLNNFFPALEQWVKEQQYQQQTWEINLENIPKSLFPVNQGDFIAYSGNTGGSQGPHVHFEIRDTRTDNVLNPLLFGFPIPDAVAPAISRLVMYDRNKSTYLQTPQHLPIKKSGNTYSLIQSNSIIVGSNKVSFAIAAVDRFSNSSNPNGIYSAKLFLDDVLITGFELDDIDYDESRYINAQLDYHYKNTAGVNVQHISKMPGDTTDLYQPVKELILNDTELHNVRIEVRDAAQNLSQIKFAIRYNPALEKPYANNSEDKLIPGHVNVFERKNFELYTSEIAVYDTINISFSEKEQPTAGAVSPVYNFLNHAYPVHDSVTIRIKPAVDIPADKRDKIIIKGVYGSRTVIQKAEWTNGWVTAKFRQFGSFQALIDDKPPTINNVTTDLSKATRIIFTPQDNFKEIKSFRAELDGQWLRFTNDKGRNFIYVFDEYFTRGTHELKVTVEDIAGNVTIKTFTVSR